MTLPVNGNPLSFQQIANEFSNGVGHPINTYYSGGSYVPSGSNGYPNEGGSTSIPSSGPAQYTIFS